MAVARSDIPYSELAAAPLSAPDHRVPYGSDPLQFGELRLPSGGGRVAVVVLIHGGCWRAQFDVRHVSQAAAALAAAGYATWTLEYRRIGNGGGGWPGTFDDVARGVDHVRSLAVTHPRLDTSRVVLVGHSAGGQLALLTASRTTPELNTELASRPTPLRVAGVVSLAGITDLAAYGAAPGGCNSAINLLMGGTAATVPERYAAVSPMQRPRIGVPVHFVHGADDKIVPLAQSEGLASLMKARGEPAARHVVAGAGHFDLVAPWSAAWSEVLRAVEFLSR